MRRPEGRRLPVISFVTLNRLQRADDAGRAPPTMPASAQDGTRPAGGGSGKRSRSEGFGRTVGFILIGLQDGSQRAVETPQRTPAPPAAFSGAGRASANR